MARSASSLSLLDVVLCGGGALMLILIPILTSISRDGARNRACVVSVLPTGGGQRRIHWDFSERASVYRASYMVAVPPEKITTGSERMTFCIPERPDGGNITLRIAVSREQMASGILPLAQGLKLNQDKNILPMQMEYRAILQRYKTLSGQSARLSTADWSDFKGKATLARRKFTALKDTGGLEGDAEKNPTTESLVLYLEYRSLAMLRQLGRELEDVKLYDDEIHRLSATADRQVQSVWAMIHLEEAMWASVPRADISGEAHELLNRQLDLARKDSTISIRSEAGDPMNDAYRNVRAEFHRFRITREYRENETDAFETPVSSADLEIAVRNDYADPVLQMICMELQEMFPTTIRMEFTASWGGQTTTETIEQQLEADDFDRYIELIRVDVPTADAPPRIETLGSTRRIVAEK